MATKRGSALTIGRRKSVDESQIFLAYPVVGEGLTQGQARLFIQGHKQKPAGILVQAVNNARPHSLLPGKLWEMRQQTLHQGFIRTGRAWMHGKTCRLVTDDETFVAPDNIQLARFWFQARLRSWQVNKDTLPTFCPEIGPCFNASIHTAVP
jgi:hypothetical protein